MALSSQLAMLNTQTPAGERAKRSRLAKKMVSWVQLPPGNGLGIPPDNERHREGAVD